MSETASYPPPEHAPSTETLAAEESLRVFRRANCKPGYYGHANRGGRALVCRRCAAMFIASIQQAD